MWPFYYDVIDLPTIKINERKLEPTNKQTKKAANRAKKEVQAHKKIYRKQGR